MKAEARQMLLFAELPVPDDARQWRMARNAAVSALAAMLACKHAPRRRRRPADWEQIPLQMVLRHLERDIDDASEYPVHLRSAAGLEPPPETDAPRSIFEMGATAERLKKFGRFGDTAGFEPSPYRVERDGDRVRVVRLRVDETEAAQERERTRRARQRPPKPTNGVRRRSKKLLDVIGSDVWED